MFEPNGTRKNYSEMSKCENPMRRTAVSFSATMRISELKTHAKPLIRDAKEGPQITSELDYFEQHPISFSCRGKYYYKLKCK